MGTAGCINSGREKKVTHGPQATTVVRSDGRRNHNPKDGVDVKEDVIVVDVKEDVIVVDVKEDVIVVDVKEDVIVVDVKEGCVPMSYMDTRPQTAPQGR